LSRIGTSYPRGLVVCCVAARAGGRMLRCGGRLVRILGKLISFYMQLIVFCVLTSKPKSPITLVMETQSSDPLNQGNKIMNIRDQLAVKKAKFEKLKKEIAALQAEAVEGGFAYYVQSTRDKVPNKNWWMDQHPKTWERYMTKTPVNTFAWKD
jgi:hypothetical protein